MSVMRPKRAKIKPKEEAAYFSSMRKDKDGFNIKYINSFKGRGVFSCRHFQKGDFLIEYRGEVLGKQEYENRLRLYHDALKVFMFEFSYNGKKLCVDAAKEDDSLGRLVNDDNIDPNSRMRTITVEGKPHLCLFAIKDIGPGEEITYNYGDSDWPWRSKILTETEDHHATVICDSLKDVEQMSTEAEGHHVVVASDSLKDIEKILTETEDHHATVICDSLKDVEQIPTDVEDHHATVASERLKDFEQVLDERDSPTMPPLLSCPDMTIPDCHSDNIHQNCKHDVVSLVVPSLEKCAVCNGPFSALRWLSIKCKVCSCVWHRSCYDKGVKKTDCERLPMVSKEPSSSDDTSEEEYVPDSCSQSDSSCSQPASKFQKRRVWPDLLVHENPLCEGADDTEQVEKTCEEEKQVSGEVQTEVQESITEDESVKGNTGTREDQCIQSSNISTSGNKKNYCYICGKPQSKIARHLKTHEKTSVDVAQVLALPKYSKERKKRLNKLRNQGNYKHNTDVLKSGTGLLKVRRKSNKKYDPKQYVHCMYCQAMYLRRDLWRHVRKCPSNPAEADAGPGRTRVLSLATMSESAQCQQISQGVWKLLTVMKDDDVSAAVRSDFCILQLAQSFFNKHGQDPTKYEYIRQKLREVGRLLLTLRKEFSVFTIEDAIRPANFHLVIQAVKKVSGFDEEKHCYKTPSLALKLGHSLQKVCDILHCRALMAGDSELKKSTQTFKTLYTSKWSELVSHTALTTLNEEHFNKPSTLPFTEDVQCLHKHLEKTASLASENLATMASPKVYGELCRATLAKIILFNRRRGGEVAKMQLKTFLEKDTSALHKDVAVGLTKFEQKLCKHFSRVEIRGKRGRKVAVLLSPDMVDSLTLLISKRKQCGIPEDNKFLFARPHCLTPYRGQDCLRAYASECGAQNPELLRSTQLRKHVATLSQVLNLKNHEMDQVADFLGHDIRVHREYYRLPEATTQLAKISKLLLAMEKGPLTNLQGKTLDEIEIEDNIDFTDSELSEESDTEEDDNPPFPRTEMGMTRDRPAVEEPPGPSGDIDSPLEGTSTGMKRDRPPVEEPPCTSEDIDSPLEGTSAAFNEYTDSVNKERGRTAEEQDQPVYPGDCPERQNQRRKQKRQWSPKEVAAIMRHFKKHIAKGKLATRIECQQCKNAEHPDLDRRSLQNIRDFVRNRGITLKKKTSQ